ncbi:uncharacterized protein LAESUDRAFT_759135 [Laetiporus sulphureus 93-53]|uniref:C2H2-type domain-containing protein n=1 Tax=Laetiporus sulphureus 93-53 TaxID=1314785 RepID=A0A165EAY1_9APHY|nr:uncharacterized protein LAESUDRAFT_759135 [Laetiporus sulphureus 93-53]KZT06624.1 hypothetical protein LAESUDRAFT_759135 [Laetiporus sulphureus 93-53]
MATAHSVIATHASTSMAQPCRHPQQSTTELRRQGEMSSSSSSSTHNVPVTLDSKEVLPSPSPSQEPAVAMRVAPDAGDTTDTTAPLKTAPDTGGEHVASSSHTPQRCVARRHSASPSGSTPPQTSADATPVVHTPLLPFASIPPLPYTLEDILYLQEVLPWEEFQELGSREVDWEDHSKLPDAGDGLEHDDFWNFFNPEGSAAFGHVSPLASQQLSPAHALGFRTAPTEYKQPKCRGPSESYWIASDSASTQAPPVLRKTDHCNLSDSENRVPEDARAAGMFMGSHNRRSQSAKAPTNGDLNASPSFACGSSSVNREPLAAALLNTGDYVLPAVISGYDFRGVTYGAASLPAGATLSAGAPLPSNDVPFVVYPAIRSSPKQEHEQWSSLPETKHCTPSVGRDVSQSPINTAAATHKRPRTPAAPALVGGPVSRDRPPTTSSSASSGSDGSEVEISDDLRVASTDLITCQWRHIVPGFPPCTHSCSPLDMWMHIRTAHVLGNRCKWGECDRTGGFSNLKRHAERDHLCIKWRCPSTRCDLSLSRFDSLARHLKTKHYCTSGDAVEEDDEIESARSGLKGSQEAQRPQRASKAGRKRPADENLDQSSRKKPYKHIRSQ